MTSLSPRLEVNLRLIQENYRTVVRSAFGIEISTVVKANAYGLGAAPIALALSQAGCETFWVARTSEGVALREVIPGANIYVFSGPEKELLEIYKTKRLRPVLNTLSQVQDWITLAEKGEVEPAAFHVETGFNRYALSSGEIRKACRLWKNGKLNIALIMSHMACVDEPGHPHNRAQLQRFKEIKKLFPRVHASLAASYGLLEKDTAFRQDLMRVGKILYGIRSPEDGQVITKPVFTLSAPVVQIRTVHKKEFVGYDATWQAKRKSRVATLAIGYADGIPRSMQEKGEIYFTKNRRTYVAPLVGRVSMDLLSCDVTDIPHDCVVEGSYAAIIDAKNDVARYTNTCGIMGYEAMTHFNDRLERVYVHK